MCAPGDPTTDERKHRMPNGPTHATIDYNAISGLCTSPTL